MSRLPRPQSSPEPRPAGFAPTLKRKVVPEEDDIAAQQPTKKPASTTGFRPNTRPLQASRNATNSTSSSSSRPVPGTVKPPARVQQSLTIPRAPAAARPTSSARGTNLPTTIRKPSSSRVPSTATKRTVSTSSPPEPTIAAPDVITNLNKRIASLESAESDRNELLATLLETKSSALNESSSSNSSANQEQIQNLQNDLIMAQMTSASVSAQLQSTSTQLAAAQAQVASLHGDLGAAKGLLRARDDTENTLRQEILALKQDVLDGKTAVASAQDECAEVRRQLAREREEAEIRIRRGERLLREAKDELEDKDARITKLRAELTGAVDAGAASLEQHRTSTLRIAMLESQLADMHRAQEQWEKERAELDEEKRVMKEEAVKGEEERKKLHEMVMELKGNIRVFCRVRPVLPSEVVENEPDPAAQIAYPDGNRPYPSGEKEIVLSAAGPEREWDAGMGNKPRKEVWNFDFDRVFNPTSTQADLFAEVSQLAQSCTDGYNVCIFAYGQTGSGKSWTMEGGTTEETMGVIPRAVAQVFRVAEDLKEKGWTYTMEGQFLEIYNETITDLLSPSPAPTDPPRKHDIHHHPTTHLTTVTDTITPTVTSPAHVQQLLAQAQKRRRVAATIMNERSSRSHSVFTLRIRGVQADGTERVGTLNLVDLAGSERLASLNHHQGASLGQSTTAERLKETQNINKSLSALGDVIAALGNGGGAHVPYRNSKLTYLLQNSLSGNSKTLMVLNLSPLAAHLNESLTSLRFATKVNNTTIGTAKKVQVGK
ncbi:Kinesin-like protein [Mycena kentingensis (nom. inval.)]|nr:Kinesin-like protein [Mycena kentingensis (nom. inval.)]